MSIPKSNHLSLQALYNFNMRKDQGTNRQDDSYRIPNNFFDAVKIYHDQTLSTRSLLIHNEKTKLSSFFFTLPAAFLMLGVTALVCVFCGLIFFGLDGFCMGFPSCKVNNALLAWTETSLKWILLLCTNINVKTSVKITNWKTWITCDTPTFLANRKYIA